MHVDNFFFIERMGRGNIKINSGVRRRDGHHSRAEFSVYPFILDNGGGNGAVYPFKPEYLSVPVHLVARILRVHHHILVPEFSLRSGSRYGKRSVFQIIKFGLFFQVHQLIIGNSRLAFGVPIDNSCAPVDQTSIIHFLEGCSDSQVSFFIKGKGLPTPV